MSTMMIRVAIVVRRKRKTISHRLAPSRGSRAFREHFWLSVTLLAGHHVASGEYSGAVFDEWQVVTDFVYLNNGGDLVQHPASSD